MRSGVPIQVTSPGARVFDSDEPKGQCPIKIEVQPHPSRHRETVALELVPWRTPSVGQRAALLIWKHQFLCQLVSAEEHLEVRNQFPSYRRRPARAVI
jgi:hypothetical protein